MCLGRNGASASGRSGRYRPYPEIVLRGLFPAGLLCNGLLLRAKEPAPTWLVILSGRRQGTYELLSNLVYGEKSSGDLVGFLNLFSVNELHTFNDLREISEAA